MVEKTRDTVGGLCCCYQEDVNARPGAVSPLLYDVGSVFSWISSRRSRGNHGLDS